VTEPSSTSLYSNRDLPEIDTTVAHAARTYDYLLGGTTNFAVDREAIERGSAAHPGGVETARTNARAQRAFLGRAVRHLAGEEGIRQFLDIGTGIPNSDNVHAVAQEVAPESRIVYVDNDPIVLAHAHTLLKSTSAGTTAYIDGDLRQPARVLRVAAGTLDLAQPVAVMLVGILHTIGDDDDPFAIVATLMDAVPSGSYLVISHLASDIRAAEMAEVFSRFNKTMRAPYVLRSHTEVSDFCAGLELVDPGVVSLNEWRPAETAAATSSEPAIPAYAAVARKP
jgi:hypothetical protein